MNKKHWLWLLVLLSSSLLAEMPVIEDFYDREYAVVFKSDGSMVPLKELGLTKPPFNLEVIGKEGNQYLFNGPDGEQYRVFIPEVVTNQTTKIEIPCDRSQIVLAEDHRLDDARGVEGDCL